MDNITQKLKEHYVKKFDEHGASSQGVDWGPQEKADIRYQVMMNVVHEADREAGFSMLDVGCGYGGQLDFAKANGYTAQFTGIDVAPNMIEHANQNLPEGEWITTDLFGWDDNRQFDYVVCNGILTQKLSTTTLEMEAFASKLIASMWAKTRKGLVFNCMTTHVDFKNDGNFYKNPLEMLAEALKYTHDVRLDHAYPLYEYAIYMYRD